MTVLSEGSIRSRGVFFSPRTRLASHWTLRKMGLQLVGALQVRCSFVDFVLCVVHGCIAISGTLCKTGSEVRRNVSSYESYLAWFHFTDHCLASLPLLRPAQGMAHPGTNKVIEKTQLFNDQQLTQTLLKDQQFAHLDFWTFASPSVSSGSASGLVTSSGRHLWLQLDIWWSVLFFLKFFTGDEQLFKKKFKLLYFFPGVFIILWTLPSSKNTSPKETKK